jgi:hypothetical protein
VAAAPHFRFAQLSFSEFNSLTNTMNEDGHTMKPVIQILEWGLYLFKGGKNWSLSRVDDARLLR